MTTTPVNFSDLEQRLSRVMQRDTFRLRRLYDNIRRAAKDGKPFDRNLRRLEEQLTRSHDQYTRRAERVPQITYPDDLPISGRRNDIEAALRDHQVIVVCGETGSGKSTQLPKMCLELGRGITGMIGHTQPRRIAARSVAARVAEELQSPPGRDVGFKIRFTDETGPETYIKLMTDGILLAETQGDRFLDAYDTLIIDEAHERSLNIDFLLGYIKRLLPQRRDLKLIITSATIDAERFAEHFSDDGKQTVPILTVEGRTYPVEVRYRPLVDEDEGKAKDGESSARKREPDPLDYLAAAVDELAAEPVIGDILIFLPTERDIRDAAKRLRGHSILGDSANRQTEILPLYGRLSTQEQNRVFQKHPWRRIVLATNVAESSLTVPHVRYVIDTGTARISRYSARSQVQRLPIEAVSQASANQRSGRCGRIGPGVCLRLYSETDFNAREEFTPPEILRTNLASAILQTAALNLGLLADFPFIDPPKPTTVRDGYKTLFELGAITEDDALTEVGRKLSRLPTDPRIGRMLLAAVEEQVLPETLVIASALESQDPRERPLEHQQAADAAHVQFADEQSDFVSLLKVWDFYHKLKRDISRSKLKLACKQNFLNYNRLREWTEIHQQLRRQVEEVHIERLAGRSRDGKNSSKRNSRNRNKQRGGTTQPEASAKDLFRAPGGVDHLAEALIENPQRLDAVHRVLLTGLLSNVAYRGDTNEYTGSGGTKFLLWPGSGLAKQKPKWLMAAELVETSNRYLRMVARIKPEWIEPAAEHLVKRTYSEPHWSADNGSAMAFEKVTLFGLTIVPRRQVRYGRIEPKISREMFLRHALVENDWQSKFDFFSHNQQLLTDVEALQSKSRRGDLLLTEDERLDFFDQRVPAEVVDGPTFNKWYKAEQQQQPRLLFLTQADLLRPDAAGVDEAEFPNAIAVGRMRLPLDYHLEPGAAQDGITLRVPKAGVNQLDPRRLGWLVPGLLQEKIVALIKTLPKNHRRLFVPAPDTAKDVLKAIGFGEGDFLRKVAAVLSKIADEPISPSAFDESRLPPHLRMNVQVVDDDGKQLAVGRDLQKIRREVGADAAEAFSAVDDSVWNRDGLTDWAFGDIPAHVDIRSGGVTLRGYPTLLDKGETVSLRLADNAAHAARQLKSGLRRLFALQVKRQLKQQVDYLPGIGQLQMIAMTMPTGSQLRADLLDLVADRAFWGDKPPAIRTQQDYNERLKFARNQITVAVQDVGAVVTPIFNAYRGVAAAVDEPRPESLGSVTSDLRLQLQHLVPAGFLLSTPWPWLKQIPRYFQGIHARLQKLSPQQVSKERQLQQQVEPYWRAYLVRKQAHDQRQVYDPHLTLFRWMIEEFRISIFCQRLGTAMPISTKRLNEQWAKVSS